MQASNCQQVKDALVDYIELEILNQERERITQHLATCTQCRREYDALANLLGSLPRAAVPDPGDAYWSLLPAQVLAEVKKKKVDDIGRVDNVVDMCSARRNKKAECATSRATEQEISASPTSSLLPTRKAAIFSKRVMLSIAAALLMAVGVVALMPGYEDSRFDASAFQSNIASTPGANAALLGLVNDDMSPAAHFGFMVQGHGVTSYRLGQLLVIGLAYSSAGDIQAAERVFMPLRAGLQDRGWTGAGLETLRGEVGFNNLTGWSAQIEEFLKHHKSKLDLLYFRTGMLSTSSTILLSADPSVIQIEKERLTVLIRALQRQTAPAGIVSALMEMHAQLLGGRVSERERRQFSRARQKLDGLMG